MKRLSHKEILGYSIGDLGINMNFQAVSFLLSFYYTDIFGISPMHMAGLLLTARIWDAVNDPVMGYLADHTKTKWGQFRPYLFWGAVPLNLILLLCFYTPDLPETGRVVYAYITYLMHGMAFTVVGLPYSSLSAVITQNQQERVVLSTFRMFMAAVVAQGVVTLGIPALTKFLQSDMAFDKQTSYTLAAVVLGLLSVTFLWISFFSTKERVKSKSEKYSLKQIFSIAIKNDALISISIAMLLNTGVWVTANAVAFYYFQYILGDESLSSQFFIYSLIGNLIGAVLAPLLSKRFEKRQIFFYGSAVVVAAGIIRYFLGEEYITLIMVISLVFSIGQLLCSITQWGMVPDTVEYGEWKTGKRAEGISFAFFSFTFKAAMALAGSMVGFVLAKTGYEANTALTDTAREGVKWLFNLVPAIYSALCIVSLLFYKIDSTLYNQILDEIKARSNNSQEILK